MRKYLLHRKNLYGIFLLIDCRHEPQNSDLEFMQLLGENEIPFVIVFTKVDKLNKTTAAVFEQKYTEK